MHTSKVFRQTNLVVEVSTGTYDSSYYAYISYVPKISAVEFYLNYPFTIVYISSLVLGRTQYSIKDDQFIKQVKGY